MELAAIWGLSQAHFTNAVRHATGNTPMLYLRRLRIVRARHILQTTKASITTVAYDCGFESSPHFARLFRQFTGLPASEYHESARTA